MLLEEFEELLDDTLPAGWLLETNRKGEIIIKTNCRKDDDGELVSMDEELDEEATFDDEETVPLEDEDEDEE